MAHLWSKLFLTFILYFALILSSPAQVTLLVPARPDITATQAKKTTQTKNTQKGQTQQKDTPKPAKEEASSQSSLPRIAEETDILITRMDAFTNTVYPMDMLQSFTMLLYNKLYPLKNGHHQVTRRDILGDIEEILYKGNKAWGANVELVHPGLYQFVLETRPWFDAQQHIFIQHYVKVMLPVYGDDTGWEEPTGQRFEIVPLTRPFGLLTPTLFSGKVILDQHPLPNCLVVIERINTDGQKVPTPWHQSIVLRTDANGRFAAVVNRSGWWCCQALIEGSPLKGADGQQTNLQLGSLYWFYVDGESQSK